MSMTRRERVLVAATSVVATSGMRGLTHREVDARACIPSGSTSNLFRTREQLVSGLVDYVAEVDVAIIERYLSSTAPDIRASYATALAAFIQEASTTGAERSRARFALAVDPLAQPIVAATRARIVDHASTLLGLSGAPHPDQTAEITLSFIDGVILAAVCLGRKPNPETVTSTIATLLATADTVHSG